MTNATKRSILRWIHLVFAIPILGYVYSPFEELPSYASVPRFIAVPVVLLSGLWMYAGSLLAVIGVGVWLGAYLLAGVGAAIIAEAVLLIGWKIWLRIRARRSHSPR